jgi:hypothetical protein
MQEPHDETTRIYDRVCTGGFVPAFLPAPRYRAIADVAIH